MRIIKFLKHLDVSGIILIFATTFNIKLGYILSLG